MNRLLATILLVFSFSIGAKAVGTEGGDSVEILRPVFSAYTLNAGSAHRADTYLSPIKYSGWSVGFGYERLQAMKFDPERWIMGLKIDVAAERTLNVSGNAAMWYVGVDASWGMMRRWRLPDSFSAGIGPAIALNGGCLYLARNGNNPASARASVNFAATGYAAWSGRLLNVPVIVRYEAMLPVIGAFFSPDYGELYYEIYLGNHSGLAHAAWWGNFFRYNHQLTADLRFGATSLRLGYRGEIFSTKVNDIVTRAFVHSAVVGVSGEWLSLNPRGRLSDEAKIISATY